MHVDSCHPVPDVGARFSVILMRWLLIDLRVTLSVVLAVDDSTGRKEGQEWPHSSRR